VLIDNLHIVDEYYIRVENLPDIESWISNVSQSFNQEKENALVTHHKKMIETCKKITQFFENKYFVNMDSKEIQVALETLGIGLEVYGQEKIYNFEPMTLRPKEKYSYEDGRSTGIEWLEAAIIDKGTNMLVMVSVFEYQDHANKVYRSFLISRSEIGRTIYQRTSQGYLYWPLIKFKEWHKKIN